MNDPYYWSANNTHIHKEKTKILKIINVFRIWKYKSCTNHVKCMNSGFLYEENKQFFCCCTHQCYEIGGNA